MLAPVSPITRPLTGPLLAAVLATSACAAPPDDADASTADASTTDAVEPTTGAAATASSDGSSSSEATTGAASPPIGPWRVMTFNVMCSSCAPGGFEDWDSRVPYTGDTIRRHDPDLIGLQELFDGGEVAQIEAELPGYTTIWFAARDPGDLDYADATIAYRSGMFEALEHGFYWLSPTPDTPYSNGFAPPQLPRLVAWARLRELDSQLEFVFATTHFDNNAPSQEMSAPLVLERTAALAGEAPVIMVGDFNSRPDSPTYAILTAGVDGEGPRFADAFVLSPAWRADSNLEPAPDYDPNQRIDHVFLAGADWQAADWAVDQWGYGATMHYTSDHFAISVEVSAP